MPFKKPFRLVHFWFTILISLLGSGLFQSIKAVEIAPDRVVIYKNVQSVDLKLHVFLPDGMKPSDSRTAVVFFFGGGWVTGDPKQFYQQAQALADQGIVAFSAEYRVASRHKTTPFECVKDGKSAIRWVRQHAKEWGVNPNKIVAAGGSAGGHVAACTGVILSAEEAGEKCEISSVPDALILFNPVLDTTASGYGTKHFAADQKKSISPSHHVRKGNPPTIIFHGTADTTVPFENAARFTELMKNAGNECVLVRFEGREHSFFNSPQFRKDVDGKDYLQTMKQSTDFLKAQKFLP